MSPGPSQLPLGVGLRDDATFANYLPGDTDDCDPPPPASLYLNGFGSRVVSRRSEIRHC